VLLPFTGVAAAVGQQGEQGILYAIEEAGGEINGRKIVIVKDDETDNPNNAVAKAKKLVEEDGVAAVVGPLLASNGAAVGERIIDWSVHPAGQTAGDYCQSCRAAYRFVPQDPRDRHVL
jgi:ABC-type branched-subunit amino acid transport system substrate-binding protein